MAETTGGPGAFAARGTAERMPPVLDQRGAARACGNREVTNA
jgi:hypothetical protein